MLSMADSTYDELTGVLIANIRHTCCVTPMPTRADLGTDCVFELQIAHVTTDVRGLLLVQNSDDASDPQLHQGYLRTTHVFRLKFLKHFRSAYACWVRVVLAFPS